MLTRKVDDWQVKGNMVSVMGLIVDSYLVIIDWL